MTEEIAEGARSDVRAPDGTRLAVYEWGDPSGPEVVLIHGFAQSHLCFAPQIATISLIGPNSVAMALQRYPHMAGTASSLMGVMQFGIGAIFGAIVGQTLDGTIAPMTTAMGIAGVLCLVSHRLLARRD